MTRMPPGGVIAGGALLQRAQGASDASRPSGCQRRPHDCAKLSAKVRAARAILNWSQTELARRTALTQYTIWRVERGGATRATTVRAISMAFREAGIHFEDTRDGGFRLWVAGPVLAKALPDDEST